MTAHVEQYNIDNTPFRVKIFEPEKCTISLLKWYDLKLNIDREKTAWDEDGNGVFPEDLRPKSHNKVYAVCIQCGKGRWVKYNAYYHLCKSCSIIGRHHSEESRKKMSESTSGEKHPMFGKHHSEKTRIIMSCAIQEIPVEEFNGFLTSGFFGKYCSKFNETIKERIREKYNRTCILCPTTEQEHVDKWGEKLPVHHIDYNKHCGCDGNECRLVPLCKECHGKTGSRRAYWEQVIMVKILEIFPDINFDNPQTTLEDFYPTELDI